MKFDRNGRIKDKIFDLASKALLFALTALFCLWMVSGAKAAPIEITGIEQQTLSDGRFALDLAFSGTISKDSIGIEYQRNFIQVSLKGVSAFPARTKALDHPLMDKIFTYQYQPDLSRARVLLKTQASTIQKNTSWEITSKGLRIIVQGNESVAVAKPAAKKEVKKEIKAEIKEETKKDSVKVIASAPSPKEESDDDKMVKEILQEAKEGVKPSAKMETTTKAATAATTTTPINSEELPLFGRAPATTATGTIVAAETKKESPIGKIFAALLMIIGIIGAGALAFRRFALGKGVGFQRQNKMIDIISTQTMGPKRSIAIVKILDQYMVVGMAGDGMTLLANLGSDINIDKYIDTVGPGVSFAGAFKGAIERDTDSLPPITQNRAKSDDGIRSMIKKRIEGFKPL